VSKGQTQTGFDILECPHLTWNPTQIVTMLEQILTGNPQQKVVNFLAGDSFLGNAKSRPLWLPLQQKQNMLLLWASFVDSKSNVWIRQKSRENRQKAGKHEHGKRKSAQEAMI
ncbi:hypothetical protein Tco_0119994, partial [Tanacetum coccineum]